MVGLQEIIEKRGNDIDALTVTKLTLEKQLESASVKTMGDRTCLLNELRSKEEEIKQLKSNHSQLKRDFDQKVQQLRMKYEEQLLSITTKQTQH